MEKTSLEKKISQDQRIMKLLKVSELRYNVAQTNLGPIDILIRSGEEKYHFLLDSSPIEEEKNETLLKMFGIN